MVTTTNHRQFTPTEFAQMQAAGVFPAGDSVALVDGEVFARPMSGVSAPYRFTFAQYELLGVVGILDEDTRVELIHGEIIQVSPIGRRHERCIFLLTRLLAGAIPPELLVGVQSPVRLNDRNAPQPDLLVVVDRGPDSPAVTAADTPLVIEVSDSTLAYDGGTKAALYAAAGIPEYWIVNLPGAILTRYTAPHEGRYTQVATARPGDTLPSTVVPALRIPLAAILN